MSEERGERHAQNRLSREKSPYLLKHASNPVDWYPWCEEAFDKARREDKPVFLSIGYFSCHWCTVMEKESFEDPEVARLMNETFVNIKVDREERPDIDELYMNVCQMMTGSGGWPLTIIMTPDKKPFFAATYIPKETRSGMVGMLDLIPRVQELWKNRKGELIHEAESVISSLKKVSRNEKGAELSDDEVEAAYEQLITSFDEEHGGFGTAPKFPSVDKLMFLLRYWKTSGSKAPLIMVEKTLRRMRAGGIFDQVGFGFHRYSTDPAWLVPHFEKMLYDQAMLAMVYTEAYQATGAEIYRRTAQQTLDYVLGHLTSPEGGFYSSEDADSEGEEGKFYVWTEQEFRKALGDDLAELGVRLFLQGGGVIHTSEGMAHVLRLARLPGEKEVEDGALDWEKYEKIRGLLLAERSLKPRPARDDKILADWNGLMVAALSKAAFAFGKDGERYLEQAKRSADLLLERMVKRGGEQGEKSQTNKLYHEYKDGVASIDGFLDDYAYLGWGLAELYQACHEVKYLKASISLAKKALTDFWDVSEGGFFRVLNNELQYRIKDAQDGSLPSGNSVMALLLTVLSRITGDAELEGKVQELERVFSGRVKSYPSAYTFLLSSTVLLRRGFREIVLVGKHPSGEMNEMICVLSKLYLPNRVLLIRNTSINPPEVDEVSNFTSSCYVPERGVAAYVCTNFACSIPAKTPAELYGQLAG